ncbi:sigma-70 family RNA polymerase sigma factor [Streptomyces sulphureus]|uniref:sigma-70 family RNA polymerase sigma factor n=1 Tax=Streptomyces sulphureus TaxID=47758 RepID=UPI00037559E7
MPKQRGRRPQATAGQSDAELVARMREGDAAAYDALYRRHVAPVRRYARTCCRDADTAEDLANEVFARTLQAVRGGKGPQSAVRAYLMTSVRHTAAAWARTSRREQLVEDFAVFAETAEESRGGVEGATDPGADVRAMHEAEQTLVVRAFRSLSEHDQMVLWHTAVEGAKPQDVAPLLGKSKGATATAAHRARENLKQAYLQAHVSSARTGSADCARYADRLGAYARGGLRLRAERGLLRHLDECAECRKAALEVKDLNQHIRVLVPVALVGWFATAGGAKAFGALVAGGTAAGSAAAGGAAASSGAGGAASEGLGTPAKVGLGLGLVAAVAAVAYALVGGGGEPKPRSQAQPPVAAPQKPSAEPEEPGPPAPVPPKPKPKPTPEPAQQPTPTKKAPSPFPTKTSPQPNPTPSKRPAPPPPAPPSETPSPPPSSPPPPPPTDYHLGRLDYDFTPGEATDPTIRTQPGSWAWQRTGLRLAGVSYATGISVHLPSSVTIDLNRSCVSFAALAGIDDLSPGQRAAQFTVHGDGRELWRSETVRNGSRPAAVRVPLEGVESLRLSVDPERPLDRLALADWADARISCA